MAIELHIQVITGLSKKEGSPSIAYDFNPTDDMSIRELFCFYAYLKYLVRVVEKMMDEEIGEELEEKKKE
jgi:hypothetical protein